MYPTHNNNYLHDCISYESTTHFEFDDKRGDKHPNTLYQVPQDMHKCGPYHNVLLPATATAGG